MNYLSLLACLALLLTNGAWAEIYETTDSEGNKVFTDTPTEQAEVVDLPEANIADSVKPTSRMEVESAPARNQPQATTQQPKDDGVYIIGDTRNERLEEEIARERRKEVLEGEKPHQVLDAEPRHESVEAREAEALRHQERAVEGAPHRAAHPVRPHR